VEQVLSSPSDSPRGRERYFTPGMGAPMVTQDWLTRSGNRTAVPMLVIRPIEFPDSSRPWSISSRVE